MNKIALLLLLVTVLLLESGYMLQLDQPIPQPAPMPPYPIPGDPTAPIHPPTNFIQMRVLQNKESVPHQKETTVRLYIRLTPHIIRPVKAPPTVVCSPPSPTPTIQSNWWDWLLFYHFPLFGTWNLFDFLKMKQQVVEHPKQNCITPMPTPINYFQNVQLRIQLQDSQTRVRLMSYLRGIPILKSNLKQETDENGESSIVVTVEREFTSESHIVLELLVPASEMKIQHMAILSLHYKGISEVLKISEQVTLRRGVSLIDSKLPLEILYHQYPSTVASWQQEQIVHVEMQMKRLVATHSVSIKQNRVHGIELVFEKLASHIVSSALTRIKLNGSNVSVNLVPWGEEQVKTIVFDIKMPPALKAGTELLMKHPKIMYHFSDSNFKYPMEIDLLEASIFRQ